MDIIIAVSFVGSLITIESGLKGFFKSFLGKRISFPSVTSQNPKVYSVIETFQKNMKSAYGNHIFSQDEISKIQSCVLDDSKFVNLYEDEKGYIKEYIYRAIEDYNESIRKSLNGDHQVLLENQESNFKNIRKTLAQIAGNNGEEQQRANGFSNFKLSSRKSTGKKESILTDKRYIDCIRNIKSNPTITIKRLSAICGESSRSIIRRLTILRNIGVIRRNGPVKGGRWEIVENNDLFN